MIGRLLRIRFWALLRRLARAGLDTDGGRQVLQEVATLDERAGRDLLIHLAARYNARLELWE